MKPSNQTPSAHHNKLILWTAAVIASVHAVLYFLILNFALSRSGDIFNLYVPSRAGGDTFYLDINEFTMLHLVAGAILFASTVLNLWLIRRTGAVLLILGLVVMACAYNAVLLGNILYQEFGTFWSVIGALAMLAVACNFSAYTVLKFYSKKRA